MYITRNIEKKIYDILKKHKIFLVIGARQVGKTTLLKHLAADKNLKYVSLKDLINRDIALKDPALFLQRFNPPVIIDDIHYVPTLLDYIVTYLKKNAIDDSIWLSSSQLFPSLKKFIEISNKSIGIIDLYGLSLDEIDNTNNNHSFLPIPERFLKLSQNKKRHSLNSIYKLIWQGPLPVFYNDDNNKDWQKYYSVYVQNLLQQDILKLLQINDEMVFFRFLCAAATQTGRIVNYAELAKAADISAPTAKQWVKTLEAAKVIYMLQPFIPPGSKYIVKAPKLYFCDTGLAAYLTRWNNPETLETGAMSNEFFVTWITMEIYKSYSTHGIIPPIYYLRNFNGKEIDLIIYEDNIAYPVIIKKTTNYNKYLKIFNILDPVANDANITIGYKGIICLTDKLDLFNKEYLAIPTWML